jgi:p-hydroxybenzoate 3-monooxygenase
VDTSPPTPGPGRRDRSVQETSSPGSRKHAQVERTPVVIIGAGPAGLVLSHLLHLQGVESVVLEARDRAYVESRVRAGVLEHGTMELLRETGVGARMDAEGLAHSGTELRVDGRSHHVDFAELTGKSIVVYGQQEVVKDLIGRRLADSGDLRFEVADVQIHDEDTDHPRVTFTHGGTAQSLAADWVVGADGFHGLSRAHVPGQVFDRQYPFAWLGILAHAAPSSAELIYAKHDRGFALHSMRSPVVTRNYLQVHPDADLADWPDERIWDELSTRLAGEDGFSLTRGEIVDKGITGMRSFVHEPMRHGRLLLAGDAAHIVPPTGAKGMNLAIADVRVLSHALGRWAATGSTEGLDAYSDTALARVWRTTHFSWWMTSMLHRFDGYDATSTPFDERVQLSQLRYTVSSRAAMTTLAENYVGLPFTTGWSYR